MRILDAVAREARRTNTNIYEICEYADGEYRSETVHMAGPRNNIYSISKNVTSLLLGIAIGEGLASETDAIRKYFPEAPDTWENIRVSHALTHTMGFEKGFLDIDVDHIGRTDFLSRIFEEPLTLEPGTKLVYSDSNYYLISRLIARVAGCTLQKYARRKLFCPLGIEGAAWCVCPEGHAMGATGLFMGVKDLARIGVAVLDGGKFAGKQIVPEQWIRKATVRQAPSGGAYLCGYGFWMDRETDAVMGRGMYGQRLIIFPAKKRVLAWEACDEGKKTEALTRFAVEENAKEDTHSEA